ncbi:MAG: type pilus assembly PilZ [Moraxellaceae bacterium]|jgi:type IV pilus assembly protein PilZ|nr:type pilus assembly PilZ [Moraxellaceae bacterium]
MNMPRAGGIINQAIKDKIALYNAYMPFVKGGGLFLPTNRQCKLGEEVFVLLTLMDDPERIPLTGKVIWINPRQQGMRAAGIGIQLIGEEGDKARRKIETFLAGALKADRPTHTM